MSKFVELYKPYNDSLIESLGLDWYEISKADNELGNGPGIYPDTAMLLEQLVLREDIGTIYEYGSGVSTLYLAAAAKKAGKDFISFEEDREWGAIAVRLLERFGFSSPIRRYDPSVVVHDIAPDLVFLDCQKDLRTLALEIHPALVGAKWIVVDDSENPRLLVPVLRSLAAVDRFNHCWFSPIGRQDRASLINCADKDYKTQEWVWSWRPDKVFW